MSVTQRIVIACDNFGCVAILVNDRSLLDARTEAGVAGWTNYLGFLGPERERLMQDFCPEHAGQDFDWETYRAQKRAEQEPNVVDPEPMVWRHCRYLEPHPAVVKPGSEVEKVRSTGKPGAECETCGEALWGERASSRSGAADE